MALIFKPRTKDPADQFHQKQFATVESFNLDGVEIARRRQKRREWPLRQVLFFALAIVSFKIFLFLDMGGGAYGAKVEELAAGGFAERMAARAMALDPVSQWVVDGLRYGSW